MVASFHRPGTSVDPAIDTAAHIFNGDGTLAASFDLRGYGFTKILDVRYAPALGMTAEQLLFLATDESGATRVVATDLTGVPHKSYTIDAVPGLSDLSLITSGANAGDFAVAETGQPAFFGRVQLP